MDQLHSLVINLLRRSTTGSTSEELSSDSKKLLEKTKVTVEKYTVTAEKMLTESVKHIKIIFKKFNKVTKQIDKRMILAQKKAELEQIIASFHDSNKHVDEYMHKTEQKLYEMLHVSGQMPEEVTYDDLKKILEITYVENIINKLFESRLRYMGRFVTYNRLIENVIESCSNLASVPDIAACEEAMINEIDADLNEDLNVSEEMRVNFLFELLFCSEKKGRHNISYDRGVAKAEVERIIREHECDVPKVLPRYVQQPAVVQNSTRKPVIVVKRRLGDYGQLPSSRSKRSFQETGNSQEPKKKRPYNRSNSDSRINKKPKSTMRSHSAGGKRNKGNKSRKNRK